MGVERTVVEMEMQEREAVASARRVGRELDSVAAKAQRAQNTAGRVDRLFQKANAKGLLGGSNVSSLLTTVAGRGFSGIPAGGKLARFGGAGLVAGLIAYAAGTIGEAGSALIEAHEAGGIPSFLADYIDQKVRHAVAGVVAGNPLNPAGRFGYQAVSKALGYNATSAGLAWDTAVDLASSGITGETSTVDAAIAQQAANRRAFMKAFDQQQAREARERQRRLEERERAFQKIDETVSARLAGLQPVSFPTKLTPALQRRIEQEQELRERLRGTIQKVRLGAGVGA